MATPFIGQITQFAGNFAPRNWARCDGQILSIAQNTALFSILGTTYGGNGQVTFALPDLRGRAAIHAGQGPGLSPYDLGQSGGSEYHTLTQAELPSHSHLVNATTAGGDAYGPAGNLPATDAAGGTAPYSTGAPNANMNASMIQPAGGSQPHNNLSPYLAINYIIGLQGIFPSRN